MSVDFEVAKILKHLAVSSEEITVYSNTSFIGLPCLFYHLSLPHISIILSCKRMQHSLKITYEKIVKSGSTIISILWSSILL